MNYMNALIILFFYYLDKSIAKFNVDCVTDIRYSYCNNLLYLTNKSFCKQIIFYVRRNRISRAGQWKPFNYNPRILCKPVSALQLHYLLKIQIKKVLVLNNCLFLKNVLYLCLCVV